MEIRIGRNVPTADIKLLWDQVGFARGRDPETIQLAVQESDLFVHAWDGHLLIGTARVLTDGAYYATVWDVIVHPQYRGKGIGRLLVHRAVEPFLNRGFQFIALFASEGKEPFYEKMGFHPHPRAMILTEADWH